MQERPRRPLGLGASEEAVSDFVGTLLLVGLVVVMGSLLAVVVSGALGTPPAPQVAFTLQSVDPGEARANVLLTNGEPTKLDALRMTLARNGSAPVEIAQASWLVTDPLVLSPGQTVGLPLVPVATFHEAIEVSIYRSDTNELLATLRTRTGPGAFPLPPPTIALRMAQLNLTADATTTHLLTATVSHPHGVMAVAELVVDLSNATQAAGTARLLVPLTDTGRNGDEVGGDGVWSALVTLPRDTPLGNYTFTVNATDVAGRTTASVNLTRNVTANATAGGNLQGGTCYGCVVTGNGTLYEGSRIYIPGSAQIREFKLVNWTYDEKYPARVDEDYAMFRIVGGTKAWSIYIQFEEQQGLPYATYMRVWNEAAETEYTPRNGTGNNYRLPLIGLKMDLLYPVESLQWVVKSGSPNPDPLGGYLAAGVLDPATFVVTYLGQDETTGNTQQSLGSGIFAVDLEVRAK